MSPQKAISVRIVAVMFGVMLASGVSAGDDLPTSQPTAPPTTQLADEPLILDCGDGVKMELALIPTGTFTMGADDGSDDQKPPHPVTISKPFHIGKHEVTQKQWQAVMGENPSRFKGDGLPVENVSWEDCQRFCRKLSAKTGQTVRLPTEAEWEYACRAGSTGRYCSGDSKDGLEEYAWYDMNSALATHPVGQKRPNAWGLHDMHGNVWEWCANWDGKYAAEAATDPAGPSSGALRILRGGAWTCDARLCGSAVRLDDRPHSRSSPFGLRVAAGESSVEPEARTSSPQQPSARPFSPEDADSLHHDVASVQPSSQPTSVPSELSSTTAPSVDNAESPPRKYKPVAIKLSGPAIGKAPYWINYSIELPRKVTKGADFLWLDNGVWLTDDPSATKVYETPGRHEITVLIVTKNNEEYRGSATVAVLESGGKVGEDYVPSTQAVDSSQQDSIGPRGKTHVVEPGDTLHSLAERYYGHGKLYGKILAANRNRLEDPNNLPVGMKLIIRP